MTRLTTTAVPTARAGDRAGQHGKEAPIFDALAASWAAAGRLVPGQQDHEWTRLTSASPWPGRWQRVPWPG
ncbi:hypothetical protein [Streptomyces sp. NPDC053079]|uniref:hypothetical protein n=1 Tax=Streptomyces sp. NPDC053079 TaxID=3365697 RepID=UPI0037D159A4